MSKGLLVSVLRDAEYRGQTHQATNLYDGFVLTGQGLPEVFSPHEAKPELVLLPGNLPGTWKAVPRTLVDEGVWTMFGGHYVTTSDSRLGAVVGHPAVVPVHDRVERTS